MKLFVGKSSWILVAISIGILLISQSIAESPTPAEGHAHEHHEVGEDGHDHDQPSADEASTSGEVSSVNEDHNHHNIDDVGGNVGGHGEPCGENGATCNSAAGLICMDEVGKCECDKNAGEVYSSELGKCEQTPSQIIPEVHDNSLESESGDHGKEESDEKVEHEHLIEEVPPPIKKTTTTTEAAVEVPENSSEDNNEGEKDVSLEIQHRAEEDDKSTELGSPGKCANVDCEQTLGQYSKCDEETGECQCSDVENLNRSLILKDDKCFINRHINDPCTSHDDCTSTIAGKAWCHMDVVSLKRFCQCEMWNYYDDSLKECLPFASEGVHSPCKTDIQCTGFEVAITGHGLGPNAKCSQQKQKCVCKTKPDGQKGFLYENYCFYQMIPGERCTLDRECEVSFPGQEVGCIDEQCLCKTGENITAISCPLDPDDANSLLGGFRRVHGDDLGEDGDLFEDDSDNVLDNLKSAMGLDVPNFVFIMIIGAVVLLAVVIISVFILRKRHRYSVVSREEPRTP